MRDIHTTIVSQHLAARDNNKILRTHPPQVSSTEENLPRHTRRTLAQLRTNKSPFLLSYLHKIDASTHPSPFTTLPPLSHSRTYHTTSLQLPTDTHHAVDPEFVEGSLRRSSPARWLAANLHKATETYSPPISREEWVDNNNTSPCGTPVFNCRVVDMLLLNVE